MNKMIKYCLFLLASTLFCSCNSDSEWKWENPLNKSEIAMLRSAVNQINSEDITVYYKKIRILSKETLPYSEVNGVRKLESYKDIYNWIKNDVKNFPLLFQYVIYDEKKLTGEERSNSRLLLWDLSEELYPFVIEEMRKNNDFDSVSLIKKLLLLL
jgi:hypothetical protein